MKMKMLSQVHEADASSYVFPPFDTSHGKQALLVTATLILTIIFALALPSLHRPSVNGNPVLPIISQSVFDALDIFIMLSFAGSFSWFLIGGNKPKFATFKRCYFIMAMISMALALSILAYALFLQNFRLVSIGNRLWGTEIFRFVFTNRRQDSQDKIILTSG